MAIPWSCPQPSSPGPRQAGNIVGFRSVHLQLGGEGGGGGRADMLEMGPWLAIGADEMTLSCFLDRSGLPGLGEQSLVVACRLFARRRVSGWSRLAGLIHRGRVCAMGHAVSVGVGIRLTSNFCYPRAAV